MVRTLRILCFALVSLAFPVCAAAEDFADAVHAYLQEYVDTHGINAGIVVGMVDEHGSRVVGYGKLDNGTDQDVNGDTLFEIGSVTKTFTGLLLQDMIQRGEMKLDDPVAMYLPAYVRMPTRGGKQITLLELATHTSGLPREAENLNPKRAINPYAEYNADKLYGFLSNYQLTRDPGAQWEYSNLGVGLLGDVIALRAGASYESLVVDRICRPLGMDSTRITLSPELRCRFAMGHNKLGYREPGRDFPALAGAGALRSTANDMLKYLAANLGLTPSALTPLMEKTHQVYFAQASGLNMGLCWWNQDVHGTRIVWHGGDTDAYLTYAGLDETRRRGVIVLANFRADADSIGDYLLASEWQADRRPTVSKVSGGNNDSFVGQYQRSPDWLPGMPRMRHVLLSAPHAAVYIAVGLCVAMLGGLLWWAGRVRKRWIVLSCAALGGALAAAMVAAAHSRAADVPAQSGIGIRREGDRLFAQATGLRIWPADVVLPPGAGELLPQSPNRFFERLGGQSTLIFSDDVHGNAAGFSLDYLGRAYWYAKICAVPPGMPAAFRPLVAVKLDGKLLDACAGNYDFGPSSELPDGAKLTIWRDRDQLVSQLWVNGVPRSEVDIYPASETSFLLIDGSQWTFVKNGKGEVTALREHSTGLGDLEGKRFASD